MLYQKAYDGKVSLLIAAKLITTPFLHHKASKALQIVVLFYASLVPADTFKFPIIKFPSHFEISGKYLLN